LALIGYTGLVVARRTWPMVYAALIAVAVNIVANVILIPPLGIVGAAIATPIGTGAFLLACQIWSRSYASWRFPWTTLLRSGIAAAAAYRTAWLAIPYVSGAATQLVLAVIVFTAVYAGLLLLLGERRFGMAEAS
jgi:O-antigen/teichoic acid export membrane protein